MNGYQEEISRIVSLNLMQQRNVMREDVANLKKIIHIRQSIHLFIREI